MRKENSGYATINMIVEENQQELEKDTWNKICWNDKAYRLMKYLCSY
jgi:hypothetical protein